LYFSDLFFWKEINKSTSAGKETYTGKEIRISDFMEELVSLCWSDAGGLQMGSKEDKF